MTLKSVTKKYAVPGFTSEDDQKDRCFYIPDQIIDPFMNALLPNLKTAFEKHVRTQHNHADFPRLNRKNIYVPGYKLTLDESKLFIIQAFNAMDPALGQRVARILDNPDYWQMTKTHPGEARGTHYPPNCKGNDLPYDVIQYEYDNTINDPIYMAHEIGHLLASIATRKNKDKKPKAHMAEIQGFFGQIIAYEFLTHHHNHALRHAASDHFIAEIIRELYFFPVALGALEAGKTAISQEKMRKTYEDVMTEYLGGQWKEFKKADQLSQNIADRTQRDENGISHFHHYPMGALLAYALHLQIYYCTAEERQKTLTAIWDGTNNITDVFSAAGIQGRKDIQNLATIVTPRILAPIRTLNIPITPAAPGITAPSVPVF